MTETLGITEKYSREIQEIGNKLRDLENGRIYEKTGAQMDGYLTTNIQQLRKMFTDLISKIDNQDPSMNEKLAEALGRIERP
ncbi:hypothetical protein NSQ38_18995 [Paenibacillus sp. FSL R7-0313]|jgi:uncharacterized protein YfkK (UPF0435 family)|uniref:hypothetical protein n=1 Tax=Paenibacillus sp. FSL R7-0313 TaxID=2954532 RepID=UPI0030D7054D